LGRRSRRRDALGSDALGRLPPGWLGPGHFGPRRVRTRGFALEALAPALLFLAAATLLGLAGGVFLLDPLPPGGVFL